MFRFAGLLTLVFVTLKLTDVIAWSWMWVISPILFSFLIFVVVFFVLAYFMSRGSKY